MKKNILAATMATALVGLLCACSWVNLVVHLHPQAGDQGLKATVTAPRPSSSAEEPEAKGMSTPEPQPTTIESIKTGSLLNSLDTDTVKGSTNGLSLNISPDRIILVDLGKTDQFTAILTDAQKRPVTIDAGDLIWSSDDSNVLRVDQQGKITSIATGSLLVTVTLKSKPQLKASASVLIIIGSTGSGNSGSGGWGGGAAAPPAIPTPVPTLNPDQVIGQIGDS